MLVVEPLNLSFLPQSSQRTNWQSSTFLKEFQTQLRAAMPGEKVENKRFAWHLYFCSCLKPCLRGLCISDTCSVGGAAYTLRFAFAPLCKSRRLCMHYRPSTYSMCTIVIMRIISSLSVRARARASCLSATSMHTNKKKNVHG